MSRGYSQFPGSMFKLGTLMSRSTIAQILAASLFLLDVDSVSAQNFTGGFSYVFPANDTGSTRFVPQFPRTPLTNQDFVSIDKNGHFSAGGSPIQFFGTNLVADGAFPTESKAWFIAGRLRKMGFNLVRFHHMDNPWSAASLFEQHWTTRQLNPVTLDRLDNILAELKKNGIYADINLHVGRTFTNMDGLPETDSLQDYGKAINFFDPAVLALHKEFARQFLTHGNPYTGTTLASDPVMAMVEITNENSLYRYWRDGRLKQIAYGGMLTTRHTKMLDSLWLSFLRSRYLTTAALASVWNAGSHPPGATNLLVNGTFESSPPSTGWVMEIHAPANATVFHDSLVVHSGKYSAKVLVSQVDGTDWHLQWKQIGLSVTKDSLYVISFAARSDSTRPLTISLMKDVSPWNGYGGMNIVLMPEWKTFTFNVRTTETVAGVIRLSFTVGAQAGVYWFDDLSMMTGGVEGLLAGESLESSFVRRIDYAQCAGFSDQRVRDLSAFYLKLQDDYFAQMLGFLKDTIKVKVPIVGTNWNIGPADMAVQSKLDYIDNHAYWDHPWFPGIPWSSTDWRISNTPMVQSPDGGTISGLMSAVPVKGKPFTISEYNHPFPNRFQSEGVLFLTGYASFHDAAGLMFFDYNSSVDDWETDRVADYFSIHRNSAMMALVPSCALAFRGRMISRARQTLVVDYAPDDYLTLPRRDNFGWTGPTLVDQKLALIYGVRTGTFASPTPFDPASLPAAPASPYVTDTKEISWNTTGLLSVAAGRFVGATGFLNSFPGQSVGPLRIRAASGFGTVTWISLTPDSVQRSKLSLLTVSTMLQNSGMVWDGTTTIHDNWGGPPTQVAPMVFSVTLTAFADSIRVSPLDPSGKETKGYLTYTPAGPNTFNVVIDQSLTVSMWFGIETFGSGVAGVVSEEKGVIPQEFSLEQNYPNPFNPSTLIRYTIAGSREDQPASGLAGGAGSKEARLVVYDLLGREVAVLVNERKVPGSYQVRFDGSGLASGVYFCRLQAGSFVQMRKMIITK
jgi:hypothetical protein